MWNDLTIQQKSHIMSMALRQGISDLRTIQDLYNQNSISTEGQYGNGGAIRISPSKRGTFTAAATKHGKSVQEFASQVLSNPDDYSAAMRKKANFARNAAKWHAEGGHLFSGEDNKESTQQLSNGAEWYPYDIVQVLGNEDIKNKIRKWQQTHSDTEQGQLAARKTWLLQDSIRREQSKKEYRPELQQIGEELGFTEEMLEAAARNYFVSANIMETLCENQAGIFTGKYKAGSPNHIFDPELSTWMDPQELYLVDEDLAKQQIERMGYKEVGDKYGLVKGAVGDRKLPVYQRYPDAINRKDLFVLGNLISNNVDDLWSPMEHAGKYPIAFYTDKDGKIYSQSWDLHDYGAASGGHTGFRDIFGLSRPAEILDEIGHPRVFVSGIVPHKYTTLSDVKDLNLNNAANIDSLEQVLENNGEIDVSNDPYNTSTVYISSPEYLEIALRRKDATAVGNYITALLGGPKQTTFKPNTKRNQFGNKFRKKFAEGGHLFGPGGITGSTLENADPYYRTYHFEPLENFRIQPAEGNSYLPNLVDFTTGRPFTGTDQVWVADGTRYPVNADNVNYQRDWYLNKGNLNVNIPLPEKIVWGMPTSNRARFIANINRKNERDAEIQTLNATANPAVRQALGIGEQEVLNRWFEKQADLNRYPDQIEVQRAQDSRRNKQFNRELANIAAAHIAIPALGTGLLASAVAAPLATVTALGTGALGANLFNKYFPNYSKDLSGLSQANLGLTPEIAGTAAEFLNPGFLLAGVPSGVLNNPVALGRGAAKIGDFIAPNITRRMVETAMRTTPFYNPMPEIIQGFKNTSWHKLGKRAKYILTGNDSGDITNRTLSAPNYAGTEYDVYTGNVGQGWFGVPEGTKHSYNDAIDAFLFRKKLHPGFATLVDIGNPNEFGMHTDYIAKNYARKAQHIPVYQVLHPSHPHRDKLLALNPGEITGVNGSVGYNQEGKELNTAGHLVQRLNGIPDGFKRPGNYFQAQDIWKFNPSDYMNKWLSPRRNTSSTTITDWVQQFGLGFVDELGTPFITRTAPTRYDSNGFLIDYSWATPDYFEKSRIGSQKFKNGGHLFFPGGATDSAVLPDVFWQPMLKQQQQKAVPVTSSGTITGNPDVKKGNGSAVQNPKYYNYVQDAIRQQDVNYLSAALTSFLLGDSDATVYKENNAEKYNIKTGDSLSSVAARFKVPLEDLIKNNPQIKNPNIVHTGDEIYIKPKTTTYKHNIRESRVREAVANTNNRLAVHLAPHDSNYAIIDKEKKTLEVFSPEGDLLRTFNDLGTGYSGNDYNTITYTGGGGGLRNMEGNLSTPAGITKIRGVSQYKGYPSFIRQRKESDGSYSDIASSIHFNYGQKGAPSNGCIRMSGQDLNALSTLLGSGDQVFTLPTNNETKFTLRDGKLNYVKTNKSEKHEKYPMPEDTPQSMLEGQASHNQQYWQDYNTEVNRDYSDLVIEFKKSGNKEYDANVKKYAQALVSNKKRLMQKLGLTSEEYNRLAELALGITQQESKFGTSLKYKRDAAAPDWVVAAGKVLTGRKPGIRSRGINKIKMEGDNKEMQNLYKEEGITPETLSSDISLSAIATIMRLADNYKRKKAVEYLGASGKVIDPYDAILYEYVGRGDMLKSGKATPENNTYLNSVKNYVNNFNLYSVYANGGHLHGWGEALKNAAAPFIRLYDNMVNTGKQIYNAVTNPASYPAYYNSSSYNPEEWTPPREWTQEDYDLQIDPELSIYDALKMAGVDFITSNPTGYRTPAQQANFKTKGSQHTRKRADGTAYALDIQPSDKRSYNLLGWQMSNPALRRYMEANGFGIYDETIPRNLAKTGGTGKHWHVGYHPDENGTMRTFYRNIADRYLFTPADEAIQVAQEPDLSAAMQYQNKKYDEVMAILNNMQKTQRQNQELDERRKNLLALVFAGTQERKPISSLEMIQRMKEIAKPTGWQLPKLINNYNYVG